MRSYVSCLLAAGLSLTGCSFAPNTPTLDFGEVIVGQSFQQSASWTHDTSPNVGIDRFSLSGSSAFSLPSYPQPFAMGVPLNASSPNLNIVFAPQAVGAAQAAVTPQGFWMGMWLVDCGLDTTLTGTGVLQVVPGSSAYVNPAPGFALGTPGAQPTAPFPAVPWRGTVDFGTVVLPNAGSWRTVKLSNPDTTDRTLDITIAIQSGVWSAELTATATSPISKVTVPAGGDFTVILHYAPTSPSKLDTATATFATANGLPHIVLDLSGKAVAP